MAKKADSIPGPIHIGKFEKMDDLKISTIHDADTVPERYLFLTMVITKKAPDLNIVKIFPVSFGLDNEQILIYSRNDLNNVGYDAKKIALVDVYPISWKGSIQVFDAPDGKQFTMKDLIMFIEQFERDTRQYMDDDPVGSSKYYNFDRFRRDFMGPFYVKWDRCTDPLIIKYISALKSDEIVDDLICQMKELYLPELIGKMEISSRTLEIRDETMRFKDNRESKIIKED